MKNDDDGGYAFPQALGYSTAFVGCEGMSLRDYFAASALAGYSARNLKGDAEGDWPTYTDIARWAYEQADAMLKARADRSRGDAVSIASVDSGSPFDREDPRRI